MNKLITSFLFIAISIPSLAAFYRPDIEDIVRRTPIPAVFTPKPSYKGWVDCLVCTTANGHVDFLWAGVGSMSREAGNYIKVTNGHTVVDVEIGRVLTSGQQIFVSGNVGSVSFGAAVGAIDQDKLSIKISGSTFHPITNTYSKRQIEDFIIDAKRRLNYHNRDLRSLYNASGQNENRNPGDNINFASSAYRRNAITVGGGRGGCNKGLNCYYVD
jgi:hypothetical protein